MKIKVFRFKNASENSDKNTIFENILFSTCILCFVVLIIVQVVLVVPSFRSALNITDKSIGLPLNGDEYLYDQGQITIKMMGEEPDPSVRVLINGDNVTQFDNTEMTLNVRDGDVVEIDGSQSFAGHIVRVESTTTNIDGKCKNALVNIEKNIKTLVKVRIK